MRASLMETTAVNTETNERTLEARVKLFASLPLDSLDRLAAASRLADIESSAATP